MKFKYFKMSYPNIKFIIQHIKLLSDTCNVIDSFNKKIQSSELLVTDMSNYSVAFKNTLGFEYTFLNYCIRFS